MNSDIVVFLKGRIEDFQAKMGQASTEVDKLGKKGGSGFQKLAAVGNAALLGVAGTAIAVGGYALHMADQFEQAQARLHTAVTNAGGDFTKLRKPIDNAIDGSAKLGFGAADVASALATMTNATHSPTTALKELGLAEDIARGRNIDLTTATSILAKVQTGHVALLGRFGIATKDATGHTISQEEAIKRLSAMYGGAASSSAETFSGKVRALKTEGQNLAVHLGMSLIPVIENLVSAVMPVVSWFERHKTAAMILAGVLGGALVVAITAATVAWVAANLAFIATPIGAIITGVVALVAGIILLWTHWDQVWKWIMAHKAYALILAVLFPIIAMIVEIVGAVHFLYANWNQIWGTIVSVTTGAWNAITGAVRGGVNAVVGAINGAWAWIVGAGNNIVKWFAGLPGAIFGALGDLAGSLYQKGVDLINGLIRGIESAAGGVVSAITKAIPGGSFVAGIAHSVGIPGFAEGGMVPGAVGAPMLAVVHGGERVIPAGGNSGGNHYVNYTVNVMAAAANPSDVGREVVNAIKQYEQRSGKGWRS